MSKKQRPCYYSALQHEHIIWGLTGLDYDLLDQWLEHLTVLEGHPSYKENIELDGFSYEAMENRNIGCLRLLKKLVDKEQTEIVGGTYSAPPMIIIDGESNVRQILLGKETIRRLFEVNVKSFAVQEGGICSHPQLSQILRQTGYDSCIIGCMNGYDFVQGQGVDGTAIPTIIKSCWEPLPRDPKTIPEMLKVYRNQPDRLIMPMPDWSWGAATPEWIEEARKQRNLVIVTASSFFTEHLPKHKHLISEVEWKPETKFTDLGAPRVAALLDIGCGCEIPKMNKHAENLLITAEKYQAIASFIGLNHKREELRNCWKTLFTAQAHDNYFDGTTPSLKAWAINLFTQAAKKAQALLLEALNHLAENVNTDLRVSGLNLNPLIIFNQLTWERTELVTFEQSFNIGEAKKIGLTDKHGNSVPHQIEDMKKYPDGSYKKIKMCFLAQLPSLGYNTYYVCSSKRSGEAEDQFIRTKQKRCSIGNEFVQVKCEKNGEIRISDLATSKEVFHGGFLTLHDQDGDDDSRQHPVKIKASESGEIRSNITLEGRFRRGSYQTAITVMKGSKKAYFKTKVKISDALIGKNVTWWCMRPESGLANNAILNIEGGTLWHDYPFGCSQTDSLMILPLNWIDYSNDKQGVSLFHSGTPCFWIKKREPLNLMNLWLWSPLASQLDWPKAKQLTRSGTYTYQYAVMPHAKNWMEGHVFHKALEYNNPPLIIRTSLHGGQLPKHKSFINIDKENVILSAFMPKTGHAMARLYEIYGRKVGFNMAFNLPDVSRVYEVDVIGNRKRALTAMDRSLSAIIRPHEIVSYSLG